jgi:hypothetical protein
VQTILAPKVKRFCVPGAMLLHWSSRSSKRSEEALHRASFVDRAAAGCGSRASRFGLRLGYRRVRYPRSERGEGTARRACRFPPPWLVEEQEACFTVRDGNGQALAYVYFEEDPGTPRGGQVAHPRRGSADRQTSPSCLNCCGTRLALSN